MKNNRNIDAFIEHYSRLILSPTNLKQAVLEDEKITKATISYSPFSSTLHSGLPGIIFLANEVNQQGILNKKATHIDSYIQLLLENVKSNPTYDISLFAGLPGVGISLLCLKREDLFPVIHQINDVLFSLIDNFIEHQKMEMGFPTKTQNFDLMYGLSGTLSYLLMCYKSNLYPEEKTTLTTYIKKIEASLVQRYVNPISFQGTSVPAWYISSKNQMSEEDIINYPFGNFNISMSHGISGIITVLTNSISMGIIQPGVKKLLKELVSFVVNNIQTSNGILSFPLMIPMNKNLKIATVKETVRFDSWCYGAPGILLALYKYAALSKDQTLIEICIKNFNYINNQPMGLNSPSICHGYAGLISIIHAASKNIPGVQNVNPQLLDNLTSFYNPNLKLGFYNQEFTNSTHTVFYPDAGILTGVSGIILALISMKYDCKSKWEELFNISFESD
ncbi:lanthionine synthetase C family protein [Pediococcus acidilactici]|uniref:lanthionine synthetase C family protein n=1 Tax=Pediococcus acidilactici TaxID=1254 RepID=UPI0026FC991E|nr:lanthionine synthetase C family protein [Pediococcus acidilactici]MDO7803155.1 lanthionine synthetase C family protein [Pediococcus acidilactici]